jgi:hypothetical protein
MIPDGEWSRYIAALSPDHCRDEGPSAACFYYCCKLRFMAGERLSDWEYIYIGVGTTPEPTDGWRYPSFSSDALADRPDLDAGLLQVLMSTDVSVSMSAFLR